MIRAIIKKEMLQNLLSYKFTIIIILSTVLTIVSMLVMFRDFQLRMENYEILRPESTVPIALIAPAPLSVLAKGLDENLCRSYEIRFGGQIRVGSKQQSVNDLFRLITTPDLLYVVKAILSLCAMLFAFDVISGEKEAGALRMSLSNSLGRTSLVIGKWLGGFLSFIIPFILAVLLGTILIVLSPQFHLDGANWTKFVVFLVSCVFYLAVFFSLGLLISGVTYRAASSLVISLFVWAVLVFVIPNLGNILARQLVEIPSVEQLEVRRQQIWIKQVFDRIQGRIDGKDAVENINAENDKLIAEYRSRFNQLVSWSQNITRFSPAAVFTFWATDLAGTGIAEQRKAKEAVLQYKDLVRNRPTDSDGNIIGELPSFSYERRGLGQILDIEALTNIFVLILFNLLFFAAAYVAFLRYDVR